MNLTILYICILLLFLPTIFVILESLPRIDLTGWVILLAWIALALTIMKAQIRIFA